MLEELLTVGRIQHRLLKCRSRREVAQVIADALVRHFGASLARMWLVDRGDICGECVLADRCPRNTHCLHLIAGSGADPQFDGRYRRVPLGVFEVGRIWQQRRRSLCNDVQHDDRFDEKDWARARGLTSFAGFPLVQDRRAVGVMAMFAQAEFPVPRLPTLELLADLAVSALESARHFQVEEELQQARKLESIGQLAAGIAHEINSPMQYVCDNVEFLDECIENLTKVLDTYETILDPCGPPKSWADRRAEIEQARRECNLSMLQEASVAVRECLEGIQRVTTITRAMKEFSHPGTKEMVLSDLNEALKSTATITRNRWKYFADLEFDLDPDLPPVECLPAELNQAFLNLVVNAADAVAEAAAHADDGPEKGTITIASRQNGDHVVIRVADTGCGIPEAVRNRIFDPFFTTKEVGKGTGQGLNIVYNVVVTQHGGTIEFTSEVGQGTEFTISLPVGRRPAAGLGEE